ncbi:hypothetical protein LTR84_003101 [Exophiala bonariae]|uniref:Uncharacterized protein n=1 Tax=Exophiala bonariae TaxID=1690606 RepID=A0AAV9NAL1_9EURO|nr:hypothetical protein LTR84_003101 [Exophiala bonariae]
MPDNASQAGGSAAASDAGTPTPAAEVSNPGARSSERQLVQFGATQYYNNYPGNVAQQMTWTNNPQRGPPSATQVTGSGFPGPVNWGQQEEAVTSFAVGSFQGYHGFSVSLRPETYLSMAPEQQAAFINLGRGNNFNTHSPSAAPPQVSAPPRSVIEEAPPEPTVPAIEESKPKCMECDKQLMINMQSYQCNNGTMCDFCYHLALRRCSAFRGNGHTC